DGVRVRGDRIDLGRGGQLTPGRGGDPAVPADRSLAAEGDRALVVPVVLGGFAAQLPLLGLVEPVLPGVPHVGRPVIGRGAQAGRTQLARVEDVGDDPAAAGDVVVGRAELLRDAGAVVGRRAPALLPGVVTRTVARGVGVAELDDVRRG